MGLMQATDNWHYPLIDGNERGYQTEILQNALFKNTLVCLPTGMGKTYVALVLMYNYARWYPLKKSIFMAPTRPLVTQQHRSWMRLFGKLQGTDSIEISATMPPERRAKLWQGRDRIIFTTPQIVENDLDNGHARTSDISCLVFDEAHRAVGNYAYCGVMRLMMTAEIRICALTATPGASIPAVQTLIDTLQIESVQFYNDESPQLKPFVSLRQKEVTMFNRSEEIEEVLSVLDSLIQKHYTQPLQLAGFAIPGEIDKISITSLLQANKTGMSGAIEGYLAGLKIMLHVRDLLLFYGILPTITYIRSLSSFNGSALKTRVINQMMQSEALIYVMQKFESISRDAHFYSHPKLKFLAELLLRHFGNSSDGSRVMIFSQYRDSVLDICEFLHRFQPRLKPASLLGTKSGSNDPVNTNQAHQQTTIDRFMAGDSNVLVTTSVGEEGLDIGSVDLIVFFDAQSSPIRSVQRSGRTGRQREGKIVILLCEGKEHQLYLKSEASSASLARALSNSFATFKLHNSKVQNMIDSSKTGPFKFTLLTSTDDQIGKAKKRTLRVKTAPVKPQQIPQVRQLEASRSIVSESTAAGIGHSTSVLEIIHLCSALETESSRKQKRCKQIFQAALHKMTIFKLFNYSPVPLCDYQFVYRSMTTEEELGLPDDFFEEDFENSKDSLSNDFSKDESFAMSVSDDELSCSSLDFDFNLNSFKSSSPAIDDVALEEFDWSDPEI